MQRIPRLRVLLLSIALVSVSLRAQAPSAEQARWAAEAKAVTITRDTWGIAHIYGHTDADAVFGMIYAQAEDDFNRIEANYLTSLGRTAEAEGEAAIWADLRQRLFIDDAQLKKIYSQSPAWLRSIDDRLGRRPQLLPRQTPGHVHPRVLTHFEPWMALSFTEGSIGGDIERVDLKALRQFYEQPKLTEHLGRLAPLKPEPPQFIARRAEPQDEPEPGGSNGIAIGPSDSATHQALLLINPHTSFFFRSELQMSSDQGLNAYGAVTWGQFFIYQGFNERAGWMHTSSGVDAVDEFVEAVEKDISQPKHLIYRYGGQSPAIGKPHTVLNREIGIAYKTANGSAVRTFVAHFTGHGPIVRYDQEGDWVSVKLMNKPMEALEQSYLRTKAHTYAEYKKTMELFANSSNNTIFADADGDIAYWHGNFIPRRDPTVDYTKPVDGSNPATDWHGLLTLDEVPHLLNPASGYLFNVNNSPWNGAGPSSLKKADYPPYVERGIESARGTHAIKLLNENHNFTLDTLMSTAYDSYLPWFARTVPALLKAYDNLPQSDPHKAALHDQIELLRAWNDRWSADSIATSLAVYWGTHLLRSAGQAARASATPSEEYIAQHATPDTLLNSLDNATKALTADFGTWQTPWGKINRFQRPHRRHRPALQRRRAEHAGPLYLCPLGLARQLRRQTVPRYEGVVRHQRQQLRRRRRVRPPRPRPRRHRRRRIRPPRHPPLHRRGRTLRIRQPPRSLLLPRPAQRPHRTHLQARQLASWSLLCCHFVVIPAGNLLLSLLLRSPLKTQRPQRIRITLWTHLQLLPST